MNHAEQLKKRAVGFANLGDAQCSPFYKAEMAGVFSAIDAMQSALDDANAKLAARDAEVERLRKDAERYRWLREQHWKTSTLAVAFYPRENVRLGTFCPSQAGLDEVIDAALSEEVKGGV